MRIIRVLTLAIDCMKTLKQISIIILCLVGLLSSVRSQNDLPKMSLEQILELTNQYGFRVKEVKQELRILQQDYKILQANNGLRVDLQGTLPNFHQSSAQVVQPDGSTSFRDITQNSVALGLNLHKDIIGSNTQFFAQSNLLRYDNFSSKNTNYYNVPLRVGLRQAINHYNSKKWQRRLLREQLSLHSKVASRQILEQQLQVVRAFFNSLKAQAEQQIALTNQENNKAILSIAEKRFELGTLSKSDLTHIKLNKIQSEQAGLRATSSYNRAKLYLDKLTNYREAFQPVMPKILPSIELVSLDSIVHRAWSENIHRARNIYQSLELDAETERVSSMYGMRGELNASVGLVKSDKTFESIYVNPQRELLFSLNVSIPVFQGKAKRLAEQKIQLQSKLNQDKKQYHEQLFKAELRHLLNQINNQQAEVARSKTIMELAEEAYQISNERFQLGNITITELTLANHARDNAWRNHIETVAQYWEQYYRIRVMTGIDLQTGNTIKMIQI